MNTIPKSNTKSWLLAMLLAAFVASLAWGILLHREAVRLRAVTSGEAVEVAELRARLAAADNARLAAEGRLFLQANGNLRHMNNDVRSTDSPETVDKFNSAVDSDPIWAPFYRKLEKRRILSRYDILFSALSIPPEKAATLVDLMVDRSISGRKTAHMLRAAGQKLDSPESVGAVGKATEEIDQKIVQLVGADTAEKLKEWRSAIYSYGNAPDGPVAQDAVTLRDAGFTVKPEQLVRLALIRYEVYALIPDKNTSPKVDAETGLTSAERRLFARDAEVLSAEEVAVLRNWAIESHKARAAVEGIRRQFHLESPPDAQ